MLATVLILSVVCTKLVEVFAEPIVDALGVSRRWLLGVSMVAGVGMAWVAKADLLRVFGIEMQPAWSGVLITGLVIGAGASVVWDLVDGWRKIGNSVRG